jgi:large subunit ribosomal protein L4
MVEMKKEESKDKEKKSKKITLKVINTSGKSVSDYTLDPLVFDGLVNTDLIHQAVVSYQANQRKGLANTKTRGEVRGGGRKPWRQKGTGRARVGSIRSPLWKGGGVTFGPKPHSFRKDFPKKMKTLAFKSALNAKQIAEEIVILDSLNMTSHKTKEFAKILKNLKITKGRTRFVTESLDLNSRRSSSNIKDVSLARAVDVHTTDILNCKKLIITKGALEAIEGRVKKCLQ